jgi:hypothetical protein
MKNTVHFIFGVYNIEMTMTAIPINLMSSYIFKAAEMNSHKNKPN